MSAIYDIAGTSNDTFMINGKATFIQGAINPENYQGLDGDLYLQSGVEGDASQVATVWIKKNGSWVDMANNALPVSSSDNKDKFLISLGDGSYGFATIKFVDGAIETVVPAGDEGNALYATMATNDQFRIRVGGEADSGWIELATGDNGREPIYVRQYTGNLKGNPTIVNEMTLLDDSGYTFLAKIPAASNATDSKQVPTIGWVNDPTKSTNVVHRTGNETIAGEKTFSTNPKIINSAPGIILQENDVSKGTTPSSVQNSFIGIVYDKNGTAQANKLSQIYTEYKNDDSFSLNISVFEPTASSTNSSKISIGYDSSKRVYTYAPTPSEDTTSSKQIDTVGARNTKLANYALDNNVVHKTGNETIAGTKTFSEVIQGTAYRAYWGDLAEYYDADNDYSVGTLVSFGGDKEITIATEDVNAIVSTNPAVIMNGNQSFEHPCPIALVGRVPVRIIGKVKKFDLLEISEIPGVARALPSLDDFNFSNVIARALESKDTEEEGLVLCVVKFEL